MPRKRKVLDQTSVVVKLCCENFDFVLQKEMQYKFQTNRSDIINKIIEELRLLKSSSNT